MNTIRSHLCGLFFGVLLVTTAAAGDGKLDPQQQQQLEATIARATNFLIASQREDGSFGSQTDPAATALITTALLRHGRSLEEPLVANALDYLEGFRRADGGIYSEGTYYKNYETCIAMLCFQAANQGGRYAELLQRADAFVKELQWDGGEGKDRSDPAYGGGGYGRHQRPDLSNTQFLIEALRAVGNDENSEAIQRALVFVSRCQNLESEHNTTPFGAKNADGGFYYSPAAGGVSQAGETPQGGLRSYGSMTYAGLKSMIYAGVAPDDERVTAAVAWIRAHYDLSTNPGMGKDGLFYYYHTFAKALAALGQSELVDADGIRHDWRSELLAELARQQRPNGSWVNDQDRWFEGDPQLVTGYALLALTYCRPSGPSE